MRWGERVLRQWREIAESYSSSTAECSFVLSLLGICAARNESLELVVQAQHAWPVHKPVAEYRMGLNAPDWLRLYHRVRVGERTVSYVLEHVELEANAPADRLAIAIDITTERVPASVQTAPLFLITWTAADDPDKRAEQAYAVLHQLAYDREPSSLDE